MSLSTESADHGRIASIILYTRASVFIKYEVGVKKREYPPAKAVIFFRGGFWGWLVSCRHPFVHGTRFCAVVVVVGGGVFLVYVMGVCRVRTTITCDKFVI